MWPDRVSNPGPLTYESGALPIALRGPALLFVPQLLNQSVVVRAVMKGVIRILWLPAVKGF